jgi:hypothetical protein
VWDCQAVLRSIAAIHLLIGAAFMTLLGRRFTSSWVLASAAGVTYCLCSSVVQPMLVMYALVALDETVDHRAALLWTCCSVAWPA